MFGLDPKVARYTWTVAAVLLLICTVYAMRSTLFIFVLALLFAYLLSPLVDLLDRWLPGRRTRVAALALTYAIFVAMVVTTAIQVGFTVAEQANSLATRLPEALAKLPQPQAASPDVLNSLKYQVLERLRNEAAQRSHDLIAALPQAGMRIITIASDLIYVVVIPILGFFFLKDAQAIRQHILELADEGPRRALLNDVLADIHLLLAHYMRALVVLSFATFAFYSAAFSFMGVPYGVLLAVAAGMLEFIPMIGPLSAGIAIALVTAATGGHLVAVIVFLLAYRLFQDYVLSPHLMKQGVAIHPLLVLFGVFAGGEIAGTAGTFLSVPVLALARILYLRFRQKRISMVSASTGALQT